MNSDKRRYRILLVVETAEEAKDVNHILRKHFSKMMTTVFKHEAVYKFVEVNPDLLLISCNETSSSQEVIEQIQKAVLPKRMPYSLLLCRTVESQEAYVMMQNGIVDNFVADRPLYDPYGVIGAVEFGLNDIEKFRALNSELRRLNGCITDVFESGDEQLKSSVQSSASVLRSISENLETLADDFQKAGRPDGSLDAKYVSDSLESFKNESLKSSRNALDDQLRQQAAWLNSSRSAYSERFDDLNLPLCEPERVHVLLIDDDDFFREALTTMLEETNITVTGVEGASAAIQAVHEFVPDVILLDYEMPELDGIEVLGQLKSDAKTRKIPVIMLTGFNSREIVKSSILAGASDFVVKPGTQDVLREKIQRCTGKEIIEFS